ncbi:2-hydroxyacid dehydrogenase [Pseudoroseicyclus sp. CXY001]|uniref:2-hydroxyacid dehydrogenase n=1 Tax=Pseudoroseicyclus sp. CXY001 TaxID=3242492 RepID=UPI003570DE66
MTEILSVTPLRPELQAELEARFTVHRLDQAEDRDAFLGAKGAAVRGLVTDGGQKIDEAFLARLPALEFLSCASAGYDGIDIAELKRRGIRMGNVSPALEDDVADTAILLLMAARRDLPRAHHHVTSGAWAEGSYPLQHSFTGGRLGIAGMGRIGQAVARRAEGFGKEIGYLARSDKPGAPGRRFADLAELAAWADDLIVCLPGGEETRHMISAEVMAALGPEGILVNVGRGSVVDEAALIAALTEGRLGAAGLDVFANEPKPDPALVTLPNVTCYPHHASGTVEARGAMARMALDNVLAYFDGRPLPHEVTL